MIQQTSVVAVEVVFQLRNLKTDMEATVTQSIAIPEAQLPKLGEILAHLTATVVDRHDRNGQFRVVDSYPSSVAVGQPVTVFSVVGGDV